ncbi:MAG: leucine-rich repeat domain-containing protein [Saccharofermentans sp.]|nr:leucine-rich repeat domain-containing protein [Saccharofermentans sp.]
MKIKRVFAFLLSASMMLSVIPAVVFAEETENSEPVETTVAESSKPEEAETPKTSEPKSSETEETEPAGTQKPEPEENKETEETTPAETKKTDVSEAEIPSESVSKSPKSAIVTGKTGTLDWSFDESTKVLTISGEGEIPDFIYDDRRSWFDYQDQVEKIVVENGVTKIGYCGLGKCKNLKTIEVASSVKSLIAFSFARNPKLESVKLPAEVEWFGHGLFQDCESLKSVTLPTGATEIGANSFTNCKNLTSITIPDGVKKIDYSSFPGCTGLTNIYIPKSVTTIGENAFSGCPLLNDVYYDGTESDWNKINIDPNNKVILSPTIHLSDGKTIPSKKSSNTLTVKGKTAKVKYKKLKKKLQTVSRGKVITVRKPQGVTTYSLVSVSKKKYKKYFKINASNGTVSVKKKLRRGTYKIKCRIKAAGNEDYKPVTKTVTFKIKVK